MNGAAPGAKIVSVARLHLRRRLHQRRAHRGHGRPRRQPRRRHRQHVDRRPARPQRRQQRPRRALQPAHRRPTASSSSSRPATPAPASTPSATPAVADEGRSRSAPRITKETWLANYGSVGRRRSYDAACRSPRAARVRTAASSRTSPRRARRSPPTPTWLPGAPVAEAGYTCRPATRCSRAPRWPPRRPPAPRRCCCRPPSRRASTRHPGPAAHGADLDRRPASRASRRTRRARASSTSPDAWDLLKTALDRPATYTVEAPV